MSKLIKKVSESMFSHTGIIVKWGEHTLIMESVEDDGVRIVPLEHYIKTMRTLTTDIMVHYLLLVMNYCKMLTMIVK
ncbi:hypothetical protein AAHB49_25150 [Bacillus cereus]